MIIPLKSGAQIVIGECLWVPGVYLSAGNVRGSLGAVATPGELDLVRAELDRAAAVIAEREAEAERRRQDRAA